MERLAVLYHSINKVSNNMDIYAEILIVSHLCVLYNEFTLLFPYTLQLESRNKNDLSSVNEPIIFTEHARNAQPFFCLIML